MAHLWPAVLRVVRWVVACCILAGGLMLVLGLLIGSSTIIGIGFTLGGGVTLIIGVVYCAVFLADDSRQRHLERHGDSGRA